MASLILSSALLSVGIAEPPGHAQRPLEVLDLGQGWVEAEGEAAAVDVTVNEAKAKALQDARQRAIEHVAGVDLQGLSVRWQQEDEAGMRDAFVSLVNQTSAAKVVEEQPPEWTMRSVMLSDNSPTPVYRVRLRMRIALEEGKADPDFQVAVALNHEVFEEGDEVRLAITATKPCFITVLNRTVTDTVIVLLPHQYRSERWVGPGDTLLVPDQDEREMGIRYRVFLPPGRDSATETIWVVATRTDREFGLELPRHGDYNHLPTRQAAVTQLARWLVQIPRDERAQAQMAYRVRRKSE